MSQRWTHKVIEVPYKLFAGKVTDRMQQELDKMGAQGWELVSAVYNETDFAMRLFFKKPA